MPVDDDYEVPALVADVRAMDRFNGRVEVTLEGNAQLDFPDGTSAMADRIIIRR